MVPSADEYSSRRFTRVFLTIVILGMAMTAVLAVFVDPWGTFGTGRIPPLLTNEREEKPKALLALDPPPQAIVLGSSQSMKLNPVCIEELTGMPAFNFGLGDSHIEDLVAAVAFYRARSRVPLRELIIAADPDLFDTREVDQRLLSSHALGPYVAAHTSVSWATATRALFGKQAALAALTSIKHRVLAGPVGHRTMTANGMLIYPDWEAQLRDGTFQLAPHMNDIAQRLKSEEEAFTELSGSRIAMFQELVRSVHQSGARVDVFIPPLHPAVAAAWSRTPMPARTKELDAILQDLDRQGVIHYLKIERVEDFGGDTAGYFDGVHMMESNTSLLLLKMFHRDHGCGH